MAQIYNRRRLSIIRSVFAWGGAAIFFVSLAFFFYSHLVAYARPVAETARGAVAFDIALFSLFALHHSVFARHAVRARVRRVVPPGLERSAYVWAASVLFIVVCALWQPVAGVFWQVGGAPRAVLWALQLFGVWLTLRSAAIIDIRDLAGLRSTDGAGRAGIAGEAGSEGAPPTVFKAAGPYAWVRHPIYTGWFLLVFATSPMTGTRLLFAVVSSAYLLLAIPLEERSLRETTNGAYERYVRQVRWKLVPGIY
jgi:methanethiol S-methyltransferase